MIKLLASKYKLRIILSAILLFLISYVLRINLVIPTFLFSLFLYFKFAYRNTDLTRISSLNLIFLFVIIFVTAYFILNRGWPIFYIPFCIIPMLATILFSNLGISLLITLASALTIASLYSQPFYILALFLISGILSSVFVFDVRRRIEIIRAGFIVGFAQMLSLFFIENFRIQDPNNYTILMLNGVVSSIIVTGVLPLFEYLFKTVTNISLLELADFNHPLLQRMMLETPGTYNHSLVVGNLSEAASRSVGANTLLARIGAYYHDIGKLKNPEYFSENQDIEMSMHDKLAPTMSKSVIINHVKEGVELAKKYRLNPVLINFISEHHGNSLVYYFYRRALENIEDDEAVREEGFRYPGPKPRTKETAIVLLADSVEAATRALKEPSPVKVEETVHKIINNKFIDGQLDGCDLTLKDLEKIASCFIRILNGIHHSRVTYPERIQESENSHKKSSKEDPHLSEKDKKGNS